MDIEDLRKFLAITESNNLQIASSKLNITAGALSKSIKRLEIKLNCQLFDRLGRNIFLNRNGEKFIQYALNLVHESDQAISEFVGNNRIQNINISGPAVLMQHWLPLIINQLNEPLYKFNIIVDWEGNSVSSLSTNKAHLALVTDRAESTNESEFTSFNLGTTQFKVVASKNHPIYFNYDQSKGITSNDLSKFAFACPTVSPFCGIKRGIGSDGWNDLTVPRTIKYHCNDFSVLTSLVQQGHALAYMPDFVASDNNFEVININDCHLTCNEKIIILYKPSQATGWLNNLIYKFSHYLKEN